MLGVCRGAVRLHAGRKEVSLEHAHAQRVVIRAVAEEFLDQLGLSREAAFPVDVDRSRIRLVDDQIDLTQIQH
jgi:hypothetical protein